jgi:TRAP-type C4-dicarboxylate transport system permease small subunit
MIRNTLARIDGFVAIACRRIVIGCFLGLFVLLALGILQRMLPLFKVPGYDELIELLFIWMTFVGALALWREGALYRVDAFERVLQGRARQALAAATHGAMLTLAVILSYAGWDFVRQSGETTPFLQIDKAYWYAAIPVCGTLMAVYSIAGLWRVLRGDIRIRHGVATLS